MMSAKIRTLVIIAACLKGRINPGAHCCCSRRVLLKSLAQKRGLCICVLVCGILINSNLTKRREYVRSEKNSRSY